MTLPRKNRSLDWCLCYQPCQWQGNPNLDCGLCSASYGTGAVMAVPAHDQRDWEFAKQFDLPIVEVVEGGNVAEAAYTEDGPHVNSDFLDGLNKEDAIS